VANTNTTTNVVQQLLAQGMLALRQMAIMPRYVNRGFEAIAGEKMSSIDVPIPSAITATAVTASNTPPDDAGISPTKVNVPLDKWYEAPFFLNDKEMLEVATGTIPMQASEAVKALANQVDNDILALYKSVYGYSGLAGTTPFSVDPSELLTADQILNDQLAPTDPRYCVINARAKANMLGLRQFSDAGWRGDTGGIAKGELGEKFGYLFAMDQNIPRHTAGTAAGATTDATGYAAGLKTVTLASAGTGTILVGDIITFAGDEQTYTVTAGDASVAGGGTVSFEPGLQVAITTAATAITLKASHRVNLAFHRDAFVLASRPFAGADPLGLGTFQSAVDPVSGLALRLEISRQHRRTRFAYDILYGVKCPRPELATRIAGE
jgi:hypothetical protein